jgi:biotin-dependent carboxylase-like uncharacterized protein
MASLRVIRPGLQTTVQDLGRWGFQAQGVPVAGAMDPCAHRISNALVSNDSGAATLEITLIGPEIEFDDARAFAVTGATFDLSLDGRPVQMNTSVMASPGARLAFGPRRTGARAYLAVSGGVEVPQMFGSRSTHLRSRMGGFEGRALKAGDRIPLGTTVRLKPDTTPVLHVASGFSRTSSGPSRIRILPGPHPDRFGPDALDALQSAAYTIETDSDRMGFRLSGPAVAHARDVQMISDATPVGALQVPASCQPLLLMADRQTTGGYPIVATVISADIPKVTQLAPGDSMAFAVCTAREALAALLEVERGLMAIETRA